MLRHARAAAGEALRLAPDSADAHAAAGYVALVGGPRRTAVASFRRALQIDPHHALASNNLGAVRVNTFRLLQAGHELSAALRSDPSLETAQGNLATLLRHGLVAATALSLVVVFLLTVPLEGELHGGTRAWRTAAGAACLSLLLWVAHRVWRLPLPARRYFILVLRRRPLHQALALVALASTANLLLIPLLSSSEALDLAYVHIGLAVVVIPVVLLVGVVAAALRGARSVGALVRRRTRRRRGPRDRSR
jgi:tetratricopeptide (TPR) repeat protein